MTQKRPLSTLSASQTAAILDNAPVAVYISALGNSEILYANRLMQEMFFTLPNQPGLTCYQAAGFEQPCPFCTVDKLRGPELVVREFSHPINHRIYQLSGKQIEWDGRMAHIEYIVDITEAKAKEDRTKVISEELQRIFSSMPCGLCVYQIDGENILPLFHNPAFYEIMGYSQEHIEFVQQRTDYLGVHPKDLASLQKKVQESIQTGMILQHTYRVWNDNKQEYHWIRLEGSIKPREDGTRLFYAAYSDVSSQKILEEELTDAYEKTQDIINTIPGGVAIYKVTGILETVYFSGGVPELTGYTAEEYRELSKCDAAQMIYQEDRDMVLSRIREAAADHKTITFEFRKQHKEGYIVWVRVQLKWIGEEDGFPLLRCVFYNISDLKKTQVEMNHLLNSIPGGIASFRITENKFIPTFYSNGLLALSNYTREEFDELLKDDVLNTIFETDRKRVTAAAKEALKSGEVLDVSYRMCHKDGDLIWVHLNGRRMGPQAETMRFYAVFTGVSVETQLFQRIVNESADGIYVIDKENYELLYANESKKLFSKSGNYIGQKCYAALHGKQEPCEFCTLKNHAPDGKSHEMPIDETGRCYSTSFRETNWNGIPAYVKYVQDVTEEVRTRREKERLEQYFQTMIRHLPGGTAVMHYDERDILVPEFLSDGFAAMTGMTLEEAWQLYRQDAMAGVHPDDRSLLSRMFKEYIASGRTNGEMTYRLRTGAGGYVWVKNTLTVIQDSNGKGRFYSNFHDMTREREEQEEFRRQYRDTLMQHYSTPGPDTLILGHCNITRNQIIEIIDHTDSDLLKTFSANREAFFNGVAGLVVDEGERQEFRNRYLNAPSLAAFAEGRTEVTLNCFIKIPKEEVGRYAEFKVNLVETPDTGDLTGILTVTDITEQTIADRILYRMSLMSYDQLIDVDLRQNRYAILGSSSGDEKTQGEGGDYSDLVTNLAQRQAVPKDQEIIAKMLNPKYMFDRLTKDASYAFSYSLKGNTGNIFAKKLMVSAIDLRLGRVCLAQTDITDAIREQRSLLNAVAYTFELLAFARIDIGQLMIHTRETVLENRPPIVVENCDDAVGRLILSYGSEQESEDMESEDMESFRLSSMKKRLKESPAGYDFVVPYRTEEGLRYKQINVLWGDRDYNTICMMRADVTDMLTEERRTKETLERALAQAETANQAKSDFLSSMSHDIRTPMNAIIGMTTIASAHLDERERVKDCLQKISFSSKHLLNLINDILDMSKIEREKIILRREKIVLSEMTGQLSAMLAPQAEAAGLDFKVLTGHIEHPCFYGDTLRMNQILINLLGNAIKFTQRGGEVVFLTEELPAAKGSGGVHYRFTVRDTGTGMTEDFLGHIFEPFIRNGNTASVEGTGLGLSITKGLVDLMGGKISVESKLRQGTAFRVELECEAVQKEESAAAKAQPEPDIVFDKKALEGRRFLVAEDNTINSEILCELLQMHGGDSVLTTNGAQAVEAFKGTPQGTYDAILMDIQMPVMNGYEATRAIRALDRFDAGTIPIIAMTANAFSEDIRAALEAGMTAHVAKPVDIRVLLETLNGILES